MLRAIPPQTMQDGRQIEEKRAKSFSETVEWNNALKPLHEEAELHENYNNIKENQTGFDTQVQTWPF